MSVTETVDGAKRVPTLRFPEFEGEWDVAKLSNKVTKVGSGVTPKGGAEVYQTHGVPLIRSQNVRDNDLELTDVAYISDEVNDSMLGSSVMPNDVLLNITGASIGRSCVVPLDFCIGNVNQHVCIIRLKPETNPKFLQTFISSYRGQKLVFQSQSGSGREGLNFENIRSFKIAFPSLPEQKKIAAFLGVVDAKIAGLKARQEGLERYKRGLMQALFSQRLRFTKPDGTAFPDWEEKQLGEVVEVVSGLTYSPDDIRDDGLLVLRSSNVKSAAITLTDQVFVDVDVEADKLTQAGDILLCVRNGSQRLIGKSALVPENMPKATHGAFMSVLRGANNALIFQLMQTELFFREVHKNLGATINSINSSDLKKFKFWLPKHPDEQQKIAGALQAMDAKIAAVAGQVATMEDFKKGLLQQMFV